VFFNIVVQESPRSWLQSVFALPSIDPGWAAVIAGLFALFAGAGIFFAAWASRKDERERVKDETFRRKLNLFLRAQHMAYVLLKVEPVSLNAARLTFSVISSKGESVPGSVSATKIRIPRPKQLEEIWNNLSDFPPSAIHEIRTITRAFAVGPEAWTGTGRS
jgi:hypothetical protein